MAEDDASAIFTLVDKRIGQDLALLGFIPVGVDLDKVLPLVGSRCFFEDRLPPGKLARKPTVDAFFRIDIELRFFLEFLGFVFGRGECNRPGKRLRKQYLWCQCRAQQ
jgi:hypothetical protein